LAIQISVPSSSCFQYASFTHLHFFATLGPLPWIDNTKKKRAKKKQAKEKSQDMRLDEDIDDNADNSVVDRFTPYLVVRASGKIRSFDFATAESGNKRNVPVGSGIILG
jgi:hypothetical protein